MRRRRPTIIGNVIFANARSGIYASGKTRATVRNNLFWKNEMDGISCWFDNADTIEGNTFVANLREGLAVIGGAKPNVARNIITSHPIGIVCSTTNGRGGQVTPPVLAKNLFWDAKTVLQIMDKATPAPDGSLAVDPQFLDAGRKTFAPAPASPSRAAGIGAADPLAPAGPWPLLAEEKAIIPVDDTRAFNNWTAADSAKPSKSAEERAETARANAQLWVADALQLEDATKRAAAIARIRQAIASPDADMAGTGLVAFQEAMEVEFDKASFRHVLRPLLQSKESDLRALACKAIALTGTSTGDLGRVLALIDDPAPEVRMALPSALKMLSPDGFTGKTGVAILKLLDRSEAKVTEAVWHAMWGTKISPELELRFVEASRNEDQGSGYSDAFYYALSVHLSKGEPTVSRLIELIPFCAITQTSDFSE